MSELYNRKEIADGVHFTSYTDKKFKINRISVFFMPKLSEDAAVNAVIPRLLTKCNEHLKTLDELNRRLSELYSADINWSVRSDTDYQVCELSANVLSNRFALDGEDLLKEIANILSDCIFRPFLEDGLFPANSLDIEKQNQIDDNNADINDKTQYAHMKAYEEAFKGEPTAIRWGGTNEQAEAITCETAMKAYRKLLEEAPVEIICTGESEFSGISDIFIEAFSKTDRKCIKHTLPVPSREKDEVSRITETLEVEQSKLVLVFKTFDRCRDLPALRVMQCLYGGCESSKLFQIVREKMSLCYYCFSRSGYANGYLTAELGIDGDNIEKAETECIRQINEIAEGNFTDEDTEKAKRYITNLYRGLYDSVSGITSDIYARVIYPEWVKSVEERTSDINAVTRDRIIKAAKALKLDTVYILKNSKEADA